MKNRRFDLNLFILTLYFILPINRVAFKMLKCDFFIFCVAQLFRLILNKT